MIKIKQDSNRIEITGHANFDCYGKDIVCASVSSIVITTVNAIESLEKETIKVNEDKGIIIEIIKETDINNKLIKNMLNLLKELEKQYPKNIKFL